MTGNRKKFMSLGLTVTLVGLAGGYYLGFAPLRVGAQLTDAVVDLLVPAADFRARRIRRDGIRAELRRVADFQARIREDTGDYVAVDSVPPGPGEGFIVKGHWRSPGRTLYRPEPLWAGEARHEESPRGEVCAVALDREPAYIAGIRLKRKGRVRCSWDLATRINNLW